MSTHDEQRAESGASLKAVVESLDLLHEKLAPVLSNDLLAHLAGVRYWALNLYQGELVKASHTDGEEGAHRA